MVPVGLICGIPVASCSLKGVFRIAHITATKFMYMKSVRPYGILTIGSPLMRKESVYLNTYPGAAPDFVESHNTLDLRSKGT